jgi:hypothetical protein
MLRSTKNASVFCPLARFSARASSAGSFLSGFDRLPLQDITSIPELGRQLPNHHQAGSVLNGNPGSVLGGNQQVFHGSHDTVGVNASQVSAIGRSDTVTATAGSLVRLANTGTDDDSVSGSDDTIVLNNAEVTLNGSSDTIRLSSSDADALSANGQSEAFVFGAALGVSSIAGFETNERLRLSASDWSDFGALQASHDLFQSGTNTIIEISASDMLTPVDTQVSQLSATNVKFV